ncbi:CRISPR-associated endonuclease Cas6 [uncultured Prevotella sp.]|jgi:hypothetical protein|uniref:CRISPR-associated endonuclease Cas6 n=1 Tax=uncultured Prevotella sp. TaxID=159272 RepID=UPI00265D2DBC|nr:CRISPR-associated endonuclease Cas6 [uncultured Prevotella sp.]
MIKHDTNHIKTFRLNFSNPISFNEIPYLRGAIIKITKKQEILFHNHDKDNTFRYDYPLIQYKRINGNAAIIFIERGTDKIIDFINNNKDIADIGNRKTTLEIEKVDANDTIVQIWESEFTYSIRKYLPLNKINYEKYIQTDDIIEKYQILENVLVGNILSFAKGMGIYFNNKIKVTILQVDEPKVYRFKNIKMMGFDIRFKSNVSLPDYIGLGKGVSIGFGMIKRL